MKTQHTPTPWTLDQRGNIVTVKRSDIEPSNAETVICDMMSFENAAFIVKAVNCHDELVEAAQLALDVLSSSIFREGETANILRAALAKAKGAA